MLRRIVSAFICLALVACVALAAELPSRQRASSGQTGPGFGWGLLSSTLGLAEAWRATPSASAALPSNLNLS